MTSTRRIKDKDGIFEEIDISDYYTYETHLSELTEIGYLIQQVDDDEDKTYYSAREGLSWSDISRIDCPVKKQILLRLIDNPRTFFVLMNTQTGKLKVIADEIGSWISSRTKVVAFLIVSNDKALADQSLQGLLKDIESIATVFLLSSNAKGVNEKIISTYIDAYSADRDGEYKMPVIVALENKDQTKRVVGLMNHINIKVKTRNSNLRYGVIFDEADDIYPRIRDKTYTVSNGSVLSLKNLLVEDDTAVHRLGFVSATEGQLLDEDFEECANAYMYIAPPVHPDYRAIHTEDVIIMHIPHPRQDTNDSYAEKIITNPEYRSHFTDKILLKNGTYGYRKIIVNGPGKTDVMEAFAKRRIEENAYAITLNMRGVKVFRPGKTPETQPIKGMRLSQALYNAYKTHGLHDKPLYIIGRRKIDRGVGFHNVPPDSDEHLVWTDEILGRVDDKNNASQKAGRLAGKVASSPQYPGKLTWWTDEQTANMIINHNKTVDIANKKQGCSILQAVKHAENEIPKESTPNNSTTSKLEGPFSSMDELINQCKLIYDSLVPRPSNVYKKPDRPMRDESGVYKCSVGEKRDKQAVSTIIEKFSGPSMANWGEGYSKAGKNEFIKRVYPAYNNDGTCVFFLRWAVKKEQT